MLEIQLIQISQYIDSQNRPIWIISGFNLVGITDFQVRSLRMAAVVVCKSRKIQDKTKLLFPIFYALLAVLIMLFWPELAALIINSHIQ